MPAIYDFTTAFLEDAAAPTLKNIIKGRKTKAQIFMRRIPIENVPMETEAATDEWLHQLFREKVRTVVIMGWWFLMKSLITMIIKSLWPRGTLLMC